MPDAPPRRFPPPWTVHERGESFQIEDAHGHVLAYVYFEDAETRRSIMGRMTRDEARRIASNLARLPALLRGKPPEA